MKYLNHITDMTSTGNSMGKLFETPYCQNKLKLTSYIKLQSILAKTKWKKRDDYNIIQQKIIKKRKKVNWTVLLNLSEVTCCAFYKLSESLKLKNGEIGLNERSALTTDFEH